MIRLYVYRIKSVLRDKTNMFWTICFPILLGTFFFLAFSSITARLENFEAIPLAVVNFNETTPIGQTLSELSEGDEAVLIITSVDAATAQRLLEEETVDGILDAEGPVLTFLQEGICQSILKSIIDRYLQVEATITAIAAENPAALPAALDILMDTDILVTSEPMSTGNSDYLMQYFYALIGMTCLFGGFFGITTARSSQASLSPLGARRSISPTPKGRMVISDFFASLTISFGGVCLLLFYLSVILGISIGTHWAAILLLCLLGCGVGVMMGMVLGVSVNSSSTVQEGIYIGTSLVLSFLAGLMYQDMRHVVEEAAPFLNRINPASLVVDSLYALDAYGAGERFWLNIFCLAAVTLVLGVVSVICLRRKRYASI